MDKNILKRTKSIIDNADNADLNDVDGLLNYYNGEIVEINNVSYQPFSDPISASKLNARYYELTGQYHPRFVQQAPIVIEGMLKRKEIVLHAGLYSPIYFDELEKILNNINNQLSSDSNNNSYVKTITKN